MGHHAYEALQRAWEGGVGIFYRKGGVDMALKIQTMRSKRDDDRVAFLLPRLT